MRKTLAVALVAATVVWACGGGSGPSAPPTPDPSPTPISFAPAGGGGSNSLSLTTSQGTDENTLVLALLATDVEDLYAVAFDLVFPTGLLTFDDAEEGSFLSANGTAATSMQLVESPAGTLVVGLALLGNVDGRGGSGTVLTLRFSRAGAGSDDMVFDNDSAFGSNGKKQEDVSWEAGRVTVPTAGT